jgi:quinolinate synthase
MPHELTIEQMREIVRLRRRHPRAEVIVHPKPWGIIVEARRSGHAVELERFDWTGAVEPDQQIPLAA